MDDMLKRLREMKAELDAERSARRADVTEILVHLRAIEARIADGDERTTAYEGSLLAALEGLEKSVGAQVD